MVKAYLHIDGFSVNAHKNYQSNLLNELDMKFALGHHYGLVEQSKQGAYLLWDYFLNKLDDKQLHGKIIIDETDITTFLPKDRKKYIGSNVSLVLPYDENLFDPNQKIGQQMSVFLSDKNTQKDMIEEAIEKVFKQLKISESQRVKNAYPHEIAPVAQYKIYLALNFIYQPSIIMLNQPLQNFTAHEQKEIIALLQQLRHKNMVLLILDSHFECIGKICNIISFFHQGKIVETGNPEKMLGIPNHAYSKALVKASFYSKKSNSLIQALADDMMPNHHIMKKMS